MEWAIGILLTIAGAVIGFGIGAGAFQFTRNAGYAIALLGIIPAVVALVLFLIWLRTP